MHVRQRADDSAVSRKFGGMETTFFRSMDRTRATHQCGRLSGSPLSIGMPLRDRQARGSRLGFARAVEVGEQGQWSSEFEAVHAEVDAKMARAKTRRLGRVALVAWIPALLLMISSLMTAHWVPLPVPGSEDPLLASGIASLAPRGLSPNWLAAHVLYEDCACSRRVGEYLLTSKRPIGLREIVILVRESGVVDQSNPAPAVAEALRGRGYTVRVCGRAQLQSDFGIVAAPLLVVTRPDGSVAYSGGHTSRKQGMDYVDRSIVARLREGHSVSPLPVFGCGVSRSLQDALDPLGLKY